MKGNVLVVRADKLGDVLLSLPSLQYLRESISNPISFSAREPILELLRPTLEKWSVRSVPLDNVGEECGNSEAFLALYCDARLAWQAWKKQMPFRIGQYTKPWSFLLFNEGARQRRSRAERNEGEYTKALVDLFLEKIGEKNKRPLKPVVLEGTDRDREGAVQKIKQIGVTGRFAVVHAGMGGSALNVEPKTYAEIIQNIQARGLEVVLSQGPLDKKINDEILRWVPGLAVVAGVSLSVLKEIFRQARLVVAPSTGPLHLAHLVGTETVGLYPPVLSQHPNRWRPWGGGGKVNILYPEVSCPAQKECWGKRCPVFPCMGDWDWITHFKKFAFEGLE